MDNSLVLLMVSIRTKTRTVLILVVMDNSLVLDLLHLMMNFTPMVLILVVMDNSLVQLSTRVMVL